MGQDICGKGAGLRRGQAGQEAQGTVATARRIAPPVYAQCCALFCFRLFPPFVLCVCVCVRARVFAHTRTAPRCV
jgi:hypothetical protein